MDAAPFSLKDSFLIDFREGRGFASGKVSHIRTQLIGCSSSVEAVLKVPRSLLGGAALRRANRNRLGGRTQKFCFFIGFCNLREADLGLNSNHRTGIGFWAKLP